MHHKTQAMNACERGERAPPRGEKGKEKVKVKGKGKEKERERGRWEMARGTVDSSSPSREP